MSVDTVNHGLHTSSAVCLHRSFTTAEAGSATPRQSLPALDFSLAGAMTIRWLSGWIGSDRSHAKPAPSKRTALPDTPVTDTGNLSRLANWPFSGQNH
ncbi:MAG: hypothetical protein K0U78_03155 [Actinomycetia bacterium]|nr:hypothetical protein [Actinomycetes bacterium]